jgi:uncharacterized protein YjbI with pentapeptide repeats
MGTFVEKLIGSVGIGYFQCGSGNSLLEARCLTRQTACSIGLLALTLVLAMMISTFGYRHALAGECSSMASPGLDWSECTKKNLVIPGSELEGANLFNTDLAQTDLSGSNLKSANLEEATLVRTSFAGAKAEKANFAKVEAYRSNFAGVAADGASFANAELQRSNFSGAQLTGANFEKAELGRANFDQATLKDVRFSLANLSRADLRTAHIDGQIVFDRAFMFLTRIEGVDLSAAQGLEQAQIDLACGNAATKLPTGLSTPASWPCQSD